MVTETIRFKRDTSFRKRMFTGDSFAHPAKMDCQFLLYLVERYTKPGETILDPMFGSGTCMLACTVGRNVVGVELEEKFIRMAQANWEKVGMMPQLGSSMGTCTIIHGDARNLSGLLADTCLFSPPYAETIQGSGADAARKRIAEGRYKGLRPDVWLSKGNIAGSTFGDGYSKNPDNIGSLPYGDIQAVITSPTYGGNSEPSMSKALLRIRTEMGRDPSKPSAQTEGYGDSPSNIGNLRYGQIDHILTSPPYESGGHHADQTGAWGGQSQALTKEQANYGQAAGQIGNLKSSNYLEAMLLVYQECFKVLRPSGLLILVLKNFIRDRKVVRLDVDTIKLCESCGFVLKETLQRELPSQSFWRVIYKQRYPDAPEIKFEDVLVFKRDT